MDLGYRRGDTVHGSVTVQLIDRYLRLESNIV